MKIAILLLLCSRYQKYNSFEEIPLFQSFLKGFYETKEDDYVYNLIIGIDNDDEYYLNHLSELKKIPNSYIQILENCQHNPVRGWNLLFEYAYTHLNCDYYFQIGDDVYIKSKLWTSQFILHLENQNNVGVVGPCELSNYYGRLHEKKEIVIENSFVHKTHYEIFGYFFHPNIENWFCDDWITFVYDNNKYAKMFTNIHCDNQIKGNRYQIKNCQQIQNYILNGKLILKHFLINNNK
jgi:hypothetical protein